MRHYGLSVCYFLTIFAFAKIGIMYIFNILYNFVLVDMATSIMLKILTLPYMIDVWS